MRIKERMMREMRMRGLQSLVRSSKMREISFWAVSLGVSLYLLWPRTVL